MTPRFLADQLLVLPRPRKRMLAMGVDACLCVLTVWLALSLRLESLVPLTGVYLWLVPGSIGLALPLFVRFGLYRAIFRYSGWNAMVAMAQACALYGLAFATVFTAISVPGIPRTVGLFQPVLLFVAVAGSRVLVRYWLGDLYRERLQRGTLPGLVIYGAGAAGRQLAVAARRVWWPLALLAAVVSRRARPVVAAALLAPAVMDALAERRLPGDAPAVLADDLAYGAGVWRGVWATGEVGALLPALTTWPRRGDG